LTPDFETTVFGHLIA